MIILAPHGVVHSCEATDTLALWITDRWDKENCQVHWIEDAEWTFCFCAGKRYVEYVYMKNIYSQGATSPLSGCGMPTRRG